VEGTLGRLIPRRLPQFDPIPLAIHAPAKGPVFRTLDFLVDGDATGSQLCQQPIEIGDAEIEHLRLRGAAEVRRRGRDCGPELITELAIGEGNC
jgi:hypothetical protein